MKAYEQGNAAYFATPPVNLIYAFNASLTTITKSSEVSLEERFKLHQEASQRIKSAAEELGLRQVSDAKSAANGMTAVGSIFPQFLRNHRLNLVRAAIFPRGIHRFGHSPAALRKRHHRCGRVAQGYQRPLLPYRVHAVFSPPCNLLLICVLRHMGISVVQQSRGDIDKIIDSLRDSLEEARASKAVNHSM